MEAEYWHELAEKREANLLLCEQAFEACAGAPPPPSLKPWKAWVIGGVVSASIVLAFLAGTHYN